MQNWQIYSCLTKNPQILRKRQLQINTTTNAHLIMITPVQSHICIQHSEVLAYVGILLFLEIKRFEWEETAQNWPTDQGQNVA